MFKLANIAMLASNSLVMIAQKVTKGINNMQSSNTTTSLCKSYTHVTTLPTSLKRCRMSIAVRMYPSHLPRQVIEFYQLCE